MSEGERTGQLTIVTMEPGSPRRSLRITAWQVLISTISTCACGVISGLRRPLPISGMVTITAKPPLTKISAKTAAGQISLSRIYSRTKVTAYSTSTPESRSFTYSAFYKEGMAEKLALFLALERTFLKTHIDQASRVMLLCLHPREYR